MSENEFSKEQIAVIEAVAKDPRVQEAADDGALMCLAGGVFIVFLAIILVIRVFI